MPAGGSLGYLTVEPPRALSYGPPAVDSSWLSQLPQEYRQGQQYARERQLQTMFQGPEGAALLANAHIDPNSLMGALAQRQGAGALQGLLPQLMDIQQGQEWNQRFGGAQGSQAQPQQQSYAAPATVGPRDDPRGKIPVIMAAARENNIDPRTAVLVARSEGLRQFTSGIKGEDSFGAFQLNTQRGMGIDFRRDTGLDPRDPKNEDESIRYAIKRAAKEGWGAFHGAKNTGIGRWQGINRGGTTQVAAAPGVGVTIRPRSDQAIDRPYSASALAAPPGATTRTPGQEVANRFPEEEGADGEGGPGTGAPAPVDQPSGSFGINPFTSSSSPNASGPANIKGPQPLRVASLGPTSLPAGQQASPPPSSPATPAGRDVVTQAPTAGTRVAQATPQAGLGIRRPTDTDEALRASETRLNNMRAYVSGRAFLTPERRASYNEQIETEQKLHDQMQDRINKEHELSAGITVKGTEAQQAAKIETAKKEEQDQLQYLRDTGEAGLEARGQIGQLNTIAELGEKAPYGGLTRVKQLLAQYGVPTSGLTDIQAYQAAIDFMAPQLRPPGSGRLMANEMAGFKAALGGLLTTPEGRKIAVANLKLMHQYKMDIGKIARDSSLAPSERMEKIADVPFPTLRTTATEQKAGQGGTTTGKLPPGNYIWTPEGLRPR